MTELRRISIEIPDSAAAKLVEWHEGTLEEAATLGLRLYSGMGKPAFDALTGLARSNQTTIVKALREAIMHASDTANAPKTQPTIGRPRINQDRDAAIFAAIGNGKTYAQTADLFNISVVRIGQIVAQERVRRGIPSREYRPSTAVKRNAKPVSEPTTTFESVITARAAAEDAFSLRTHVSDVVLAMSAGAPVAAALAKYGMDQITTEEAEAAYAAFCEALPDHASATRGAKANAAFAGIHAVEVLRLKDSGVQPTPTPEVKPKKLFLPGLMTRHPDEQPAEVVEDTRTAIERNVVDPEFGF